MGQGLRAVTPSQPAAAVKTHRGARGPTPRSRRWPVIPSSGHDARDRRAHAKSRRSQKQGWHRREGRARACAHPGGGGVPKAWHPDTAASPPADTGNEGPGATAIERLCLCPPTRASPGQWGGWGGTGPQPRGKGEPRSIPAPADPPSVPIPAVGGGGEAAVGAPCPQPHCAGKQNGKNGKPGRRENGKTGAGRGRRRRAGGEEGMGAPVPEPGPAPAAPVASTHRRRPGLAPPPPPPPRVGAEAAPRGEVSRPHFRRGCAGVGGGWGERWDGAYGDSMSLYGPGVCLRPQHPRGKLPGGGPTRVGPARVEGGRGSQGAGGCGVNPPPPRPPVTQDPSVGWVRVGASRRGWGGRVWDPRTPSQLPVPWVP